MEPVYWQFTFTKQERNKGTGCEIVRSTKSNIRTRSIQLACRSTSSPVLPYWTDDLAGAELQRDHPLLISLQFIQAPTIIDYRPYLKAEKPRLTSIIETRLLSTSILSKIGLVNIPALRLSNLVCPFVKFHTVDSQTFYFIKNYSKGELLEERPYRWSSRRIPYCRLLNFRTPAASISEYFQFPYFSTTGLSSAKFLLFPNAFRIRN